MNSLLIINNPFNERNKMEKVETLSWKNQWVGSKEIPTDIPDGQTPVRGVVTRKFKVIFDEVFFVNTEDVYTKPIIESWVTYEPKRSFYNIVGNSIKKKKDNYQFWGHCMWEYSMFNIEENKWERFRMLV